MKLYFSPKLLSVLSKQLA